MPRPSAAVPQVELSADEARRFALAAQHLVGSPDRRAGVAGMLGSLRAVQLDTISVLARSHELVAYARLGAVARKKIEAAYWGPTSDTFEYWSHAACILPIELWPAFSAKRRARTERGYRWHQLKNQQKSCAEVVQRLREDGPLTSRELGGAKKGGQWWDWSEIKIAAEWLLDTGTIVCRERRGFERVYDLAERSIPPELLHLDLDDATCANVLVDSGLRAMGVATAVDLAAYHGMHINAVRAALKALPPREVHVEGWRDVAYLSEHAERGLRPGLRGRTVLLSPFDPLLWDRARLERLFQTTYRLEAYVPAFKRVVGYFAMPVLANDQLVGLVDPKRIGDTLHARHVVVNASSDVDAIALAIRDAASWVGCDNVVIDRVTPTSSKKSLLTSLASKS